MDSYWSQNFIIDEKEYEVNLYRYSSKCIAMKCEGDFGKFFSYKFKEIGGLFNRSLNFSTHQKKEKSPGWIFRNTTDSNEKLNNLLSDIHQGKCDPQVINNNIDNKKIFNNLQKLIDSLTDEKEEVIFLDNSDMTIIFYYNYEEEDIKDGECIYSVLSSKKKLEVHQIDKVN
jgi:hypothetical protein